MRFLTSVVRSCCARNLSALALLLTSWSVTAFAQEQSAPAQVISPRPGRPLILNQDHYRLRAGELARVDALSETLDFLSHAKFRRVETAGKEARNRGRAESGGEVLLAVSLAMEPGEYTLTLSATAETGERREATLLVAVDALVSVPSNATQPPVILLNGWQGKTCSPSPASETFDNLSNYLTQNDSVPVVYWFDNCTVCPNCLIETLGSDLAQVIGSIQYDNGTPLPRLT